MQRICLFSGIAIAAIAVTTTNAIAQVPDSIQRGQGISQNPANPSVRADKPSHDQFQTPRTHMQDFGTPGRRYSIAPRASRTIVGQSADAELATCLSIDNQGEIDAAHMALQKSQNAEVKQFAQEMVDAHAKMIQDLQRFTGGAVQTSATAPAGAGQAPVGTVQQAGGAAHQAANGLDHIALKQELADQCKQTMQREWGEKSGAEFDKCYIGQQIGAHLHAIDAMRVAQNHASPELQQALDQGVQTASAHLQHAKDLMKKLEGQSASR
jgi:predicted outer membrane protein